MGRAAGHDVNALQPLQVFPGQLNIIQYHPPLLNPGADGVPQGPGLLVNLLQHEVGVAAPLRVRELPGDFLRLFLHLFSQGVVKRHTTGREDRHIPLIQVGHLAGIL